MFGYQIEHVDAGAGGGRRRIHLLDHHGAVRHRPQYSPAPDSPAGSPSATRTSAASTRSAPAHACRNTFRSICRSRRCRSTGRRRGRACRPSSRRPRCDGTSRRDTGRASPRRSSSGNRCGARTSDSSCSHSARSVGTCWVVCSSGQVEEACAAMFARIAMQLASAAIAVRPREGEKAIKAPVKFSTAAKQRKTKSRSKVKSTQDRDGLMAWVPRRQPPALPRRDAPGLCEGKRNAERRGGLRQAPGVAASPPRHACVVRRARADRIAPSCPSRAELNAVRCNGSHAI